MNVSQLLLAALGTVREFDFSESLPDAADELHLHGPVSGYTRLTRTSEGILVHTEHVALVSLECSRCLDAVDAKIEGVLDEEFLPSTDVRSGLPVELPDEEDALRIDEYHEIDLDEVLRQNILTNIPYAPLCEAACPGLCATCGQRLDARHRTHPESPEPELPADPSSPFARLAVLLHPEEER